MDLLTLTRLIENGSENFYVHLKINDQKKAAELYWIDRQWHFRPFAYQGEWVIVLHPLDLSFFDRRALALVMTDFLLTEYYYYELFPDEERLFRKKLLLHHFGLRRCEQYKEEMKQFELALTGMIKKHLPAPTLVLLPKEE